MAADVFSWTRLLFERTAAPSAHHAKRHHHPQALTLPKRQMLSVRRPLGRDVHCIEGSMWLTFDGDPRDVVLCAGETHRCDRNSPLIVQALEDAHLRIE